MDKPKEGGQTDRGEGSEEEGVRRQDDREVRGPGKGHHRGRQVCYKPRAQRRSPHYRCPFRGGRTPAFVVSELTKIGLSDSELTQQQLSLPVYGNYCGFGHGDPTGNTPPVDAVDAVCREHDRCYALSTASSIGGAIETSSKACQAP